MTDAGSANPDEMRLIARWVTLGAVALSLAYAPLLIFVASPASFYTLDDPYIHMALAENIARGHFGVNPGEYANPSSSIAWPWLLAAFEKLGVMLYAPLLVNIACFVATVRVILAFSLKRMAGDARAARNALIVLGLALLAFNVFGVIFTGMEHSLHVLLSVVAVTRLIDAKYDRWTLLVLMLGPLVRFEGAIVLAFGVGAALVDRRWMFAGLAVPAAMAPVALYGWWLTSLGLPALPSSVLSKSAAAGVVVDGGGGVAGGLLATFLNNAQSPAGPLLGVMALGLAYGAWKRSGRDRVLALGLVAVLVLAMMLGRMDSYARYEVYVFCVIAMGLVHLLQPELHVLAQSLVRSVVLDMGVALLGGSLGVYVFATTPLGARNIDRQQHQMHRLVTECWRQPVAVNDLGWVSFRNDAYVLDLWGLGSEEARKARSAGEPGWMAKLATDKNVGLAMVYPGWFEGDLPPEWTAMGEIGFTERGITPFAPATTVFATYPDAQDEIRACMQRLSDSSPAGGLVKILD